MSSGVVRAPGWRRHRYRPGRALLLAGLSWLLLFGEPAQAGHRGERASASLQSWLQGRHHLKQELAASLGNKEQRRLFVNRVQQAIDSNRIGKKSGRWLLKFTAHLRQHPERPASVSGDRFLEQLTKARDLGAKTGVARWVRHYADSYLENGLESGAPDNDPKFVAKAKRLRQKVEALPVRPPLVIGLDGADGAGKSSSVKRLRWALEQMGYRVLDRVPHLGKPPAGVSYLSYFKKEVGPLPKAGEVLFLDRSMLGQVVYGKDPPSARAAMGYLKQSLAPLHGEAKVIVAQLPRPRQVQTYGKRLAREPFADGLPVARLSPSDTPAFGKLVEVNRAFAEAASLFPADTQLIDVGQRAPARRQMLKFVGDTIVEAARLALRSAVR